MSRTTLNHKGFSGSYEISLEDDCLYGKILFIDDLIVYEGQTPQGLNDAFVSAVDRYLAHCLDTGKPANKPYSGTFNVRVGPELHRKSVQHGRRIGLGLNEFLIKVLQDVDEGNGKTKVEHVHQHFVTVHSNPVSETRLATMQQPTEWESFNATIQ